MRSDDLTRLSAIEQRDRIASRKASPVEVLDAHLAVIERLNPALNAVVTLAEESARADARAVEAAIGRGETPGPLAGLPVLIKDTAPTRGIRTTFGSPLFADNVPDEDAEVVARLRAAGAIVLGKTNTPEFAAGANTVNEVFGATLNPWKTALSPAGSSGGSAVAVATGMAPLAQGTDYGGSLRTPAAFCGVVGLRTTPGLVPAQPTPLPFHPGQVQGPLARTAEDIALAVDAMAGYSATSPLSMPPPWDSCLAEMRRLATPGEWRLAWVSDIAGIGVDPEVETVCRRALDRLRAAGVAVEEIALDLSAGREAYKALRGERMAGQFFSRLDRVDEFGGNLAGNIKQGLALSVRDTAEAEQVRARLWHAVRAQLETYDAVLTPTAPVLPFPVEQNYPERIGDTVLENYIDWIAPTFLVTLAGYPASSVPAGLSASGLPVGMQVIGPRLAEPKILAITKAIADANPVGWPPAAG
jgi:amidase